MQVNIKKPFVMQNSSHKYRTEAAKANLMQVISPDLEKDQLITEYVTLAAARAHRNHQVSIDNHIHNRNYFH